MRKGAFTRRWFKLIPGLVSHWINKKGRVFNFKTKTFLAYNSNIKGYPRVEINSGGKRKQMFVHRLVALTWKHNPDPENKIEVNHLDFNIRNFICDNLRWDSPQDNHDHMRQRVAIEKFSYAYLNDLSKDETVIDYKNDDPPF